MQHIEIAIGTSILVFCGGAILIGPAQIAPAVALFAVLSAILAYFHKHPPSDTYEADDRYLPGIRLTGERRQRAAWIVGLQQLHQIVGGGRRSRLLEDHLEQLYEEERANRRRE